MEGVGNRISIIEDDEMTEYRTNNINEYLFVGNERLSYDMNGNLTKYKNKNFYYNYNNQLIMAEVEDEVYPFRYDVFGRRVGQKVKLLFWVWKYHFYDGQRVIMDVTPAIMPAERWYTYGIGIDELLYAFYSLNGAWQHLWYHTDALGSIYALTDDTVNIVEYYEYDIYGAPAIYDAVDGQRRSVSAYANRYLFTGREYHLATELYYYRARWYSPTLGRFLQRDPGAEWLWYFYTSNNPVLFSDPTGEQKRHSCCVDSISIGEEDSWVELAAAYGSGKAKGLVVKEHKTDSEIRYNANYRFVVTVKVEGDPKGCEFLQEVWTEAGDKWRLDAKYYWDEAKQRWMKDAAYPYGRYEYEEYGIVADVFIRVTHPADDCREIIGEDLGKFQYIDAPGLPYRPPKYKGFSRSCSFSAKFRLTITESDGEKYYGPEWTIDFEVRDARKMLYGAKTDLPKTVQVRR